MSEIFADLIAKNVDPIDSHEALFSCLVTDFSSGR